MTSDVSDGHVTLRLLLAEETIARIKQVEESPECGFVPRGCIHESIVTNTISRLGMKEAFVGHPPTRELIEEMAEKVESLEPLPERGMDTSPFLVRVRPGKAYILRAISSECGRSDLPEESRLMTAFFRIGLEDIDGGSPNQADVSRVSGGGSGEQGHQV